jgi:hypothetical protein
MTGVMAMTEATTIEATTITGVTDMIEATAMTEGIIMVSSGRDSPMGNHRDNLMGSRKDSLMDPGLMCSNL